MTVPQHVQLFQLLEKKTGAGELDWKPTFSSDDAFEVSFRTSGVRVSRTEEGFNELYLLEILNSTGEVADSFTPSDLDNQGIVDAYSRVSRLYSLALRKARGADKILDDLISKLK